MVVIDLAAVVTALAGLVGAAAAFVTVWRTGRKVGEVVETVKRVETVVVEKVDKVAEHVKVVEAAVETSNSLRLGEMADREESRRIKDIPQAEQTAEEKLHLREVPNGGPPPSPPPTTGVTPPPTDTPDPPPVSAQDKGVERKDVPS